MNPYVRTKGIDRQHRLTGKVWWSMKDRCNNPKSQNYKNYGGRGITYDPKWETFEGFYNDTGYQPPGLTLDRIDNDGPYCKANCRWTTRSVQQRNKRPFARK